MGQTLLIKCPKCGNNYRWNAGPGFIVVETLHCDRCGQEKTIKKTDTFEPGDYYCKCGGMFTDDAPVRCPQCGTVVENVKEHLEGVMCWD